MNKIKKGFTLVELLIVIVVLGIITVLAVPSIKTLVDKMNEKSSNAKEKLIKSAAIIYGEDHANQIKAKLSNSTPGGETCDRPIEGGCEYSYTINVATLLDAGSLKSDSGSIYNKEVCNIYSDSDKNKCLDCLNIELVFTSKNNNATANIDFSTATSNTSCEAVKLN